MALPAPALLSPAKRSDSTVWTVVRETKESQARDAVTLYLSLPPEARSTLTLTAWLAMASKQRREILRSCGRARHSGRSSRRWPLAWLSSSEAHKPLDEDALSAEERKQRRLERWTTSAGVLKLDPAFRALPGTTDGEVPLRGEGAAADATKCVNGGSTHRRVQSAPLPSSALRQIRGQELPAPMRLSSRCIAACHRRFSLPSLREAQI